MTDSQRARALRLADFLDELRYAGAFHDAAFLRELAAEPERVPLTDDFVYRVVRSEQPDLSEDSKAWKELFAECRYWLNAAHGITGDAK